MTPEPSSRIIVGYMATEGGADALAFGAELADAYRAELMLTSIVSSVRIEDTDERTAGSIVNSGQLDAATRALHEATAQLGGVAGLARYQWATGARTQPSNDD